MEGSLLPTQRRADQEPATTSPTSQGPATRDPQAQSDPRSPDQNDHETKLMASMGFPTHFQSTAGKDVKDPKCKLEGVRKNQARKYRQYMNRKGGFNRPLDQAY